MNGANPVVRLLAMRKNANLLFSEDAARPADVDSAAADLEDKFDPSKNPEQVAVILQICEDLGLKKFAEFALSLMQTFPWERPNS